MYGRILSPATFLLHFCGSAKVVENWSHLQYGILHFIFWWCKDAEQTCHSSPRILSLRSRVLMLRPFLAETKLCQEQNLLSYGLGSVKMMCSCFFLFWGVERGCSHLQVLQSTAPLDLLTGAVIALETQKQNLLVAWNVSAYSYLF